MIISSATLHHKAVYLCGVIILMVSSALAQYSVWNPSLAGNIEGWDGTVVDGRDNGAFQCTSAYQAISSAADPVAGSGSVVVTAEAPFCSLTQQLKFTATGQTLSIAAEISHDGTWDRLHFGFYEENVWDIMPAASVDIIGTVPADTDGTLDTFYRVEVTGELTNTSNPVRVFFGSACTPYAGGAQNISGPTASKFAVDFVQTPPSSVGEWQLY